MAGGMLECPLNGGGGTNEAMKPCILGTALAEYDGTSGRIVGVGGAAGSALGDSLLRHVSRNRSRAEKRTT